MTTPIARLHALEMTLAVIIADIAARTRNGDDWMKDRKAIILTNLADNEQAVEQEIGHSDGLAAMHTAAAAIFGEAEDILKGLRGGGDVTKAP